jgi:protein TonB
MNNTADSNNALSVVQVVAYGNENKERVYQVVEEQPGFPGGMGELMKFLSRNTKYPEECKEKNIQGKAFVSFVVDKSGVIRDVEIMKSSGNSLLDTEAVRVVKSMPAWNPGKQGGEAVNARFVLPVMYRLQ